MRQKTWLFNVVVAARLPGLLNASRQAICHFWCCGLWVARAWTLCLIIYCTNFSGEHIYHGPLHWVANLTFFFIKHFVFWKQIWTFQVCSIKSSVVLLYTKSVYRCTALTELNPFASFAEMEESQWFEMKLYIQTSDSKFVLCTVSLSFLAVCERCN